MTMYETTVMSHQSMAQFTRMFDNEIGTEREVTQHELNHYSVLCLELEGNEVGVCRKIEQAVLDADNNNNFRNK